MNILYAASEAAPFIKTGGLADVAGSLPKAIKNQGHNISVVIPLYSSINQYYKDRMNYIGYYYVNVNGVDKYVGVFETDYFGVKYYFIDNEDYFKRSQIYGEFDDAERFIFFNLAVLFLGKFLGYQIDIIHANDWHTGLLPVYINQYREVDEYFKNMKSLYTIHNINYQGIFDKSVFFMSGLDYKYFNHNDLEFYDRVSFMKGGIIHSTKFNTVSKTYADEIKYGFYANGLEGVIGNHSYKLTGIVNGIDYDEWNPSTDPNLVANYDVKSFEKKKINKTNLQRMYGLEINENIPMIGMVTRLTDKKGIDLLIDTLERFIHRNVQFVLLGTGEPGYEYVLKGLEYKYNGKVASRMYYSNKEANMIYAASDFYLMPSITEPCGISQIIALRYGAAPIVRETGGLKDTVKDFYDHNLEGNGFVFPHIVADELLYKIHQAIDLYENDKEKLNILIENAMNSKFNWDKSSLEYIELYRSL